MKPKNKIVRNLQKPVQKYRFYLQSAFTALCVWIGIEFFMFVRYLESNGATEFFRRPPGVDGFLPISSMMSLYYTLISGEIHPAHPAGLFIFLAIVLVSFAFGKAFCSWLCPVGFISELVGDFGKKIFGKDLRVPKFLDYPLRALKYLMLAFFVYSIFFLMSRAALKAFLDSPYNIVADIKMYYFFAEISQFSLIVIAVLLLLSVVIRGFWCRYLCPYGALLGMVSFLSPNKIKRNELNCIDCGKCTKVCPSAIKVDKMKIVLSDECTSCLNCVDVCPVADTLEVKPVFGNKAVNKKLIAAGIAAIFVLVTGIGVISGYWQNKVTKEEYLMYYQEMDSYGHPRGVEETQKFNEEAAKKLKQD